MLIYCTTISGTTLGVDGRLIHVEVDISDGLPAINMVGMLSSEVKEAGERVRTALKNTGFSIPPKRITVNLSPADIKKQGTSYDLPIAAAILASLGSFPRERIENILIMGELGLNGTIRPVKGILPVILEAKQMGIATCILPIENVEEGSMVEGVKIVGTESLEKLCEYLKTGELPMMTGEKKEEITVTQSRVDFSEVNGQE
ncbi:MAG: magnesium chelatase, partial [Lachnospiraceae bacterium]|nr:magnesium chelatase [Lachnospiraceae bacterium]